MALNWPEVVQGGAAVATLALAIAAFWQIRVSNRAAQGATDAAIAAERASEEAIRTRIDQRAPIVVGLPLIPDWPPQLHRTLSRVPSGGDPSLLDPINLHASAVIDENRVFVFPRDENQFLWFKIWGLVTNEGRTTAVARLDGDARFVEDGGPLAAYLDGPLRIPQAVGAERDRTFALKPRLSAVFTWAAGRPLHEWADAHSSPDPPNPNGALFLSITVLDGFEDGVIDHLYAVVAARPIEPVPHEAGHWRLARTQQVGVTRYPTQRHYRGLGEWLPKEPPWTKDFTGPG